ncbi:MAG: transglycosylase SLT domain-containing protein [Pseudobdellovibrionaceae bacterium]
MTIFIAVLLASSTVWGQVAELPLKSDLSSLGANTNNRVPFDLKKYKGDHKDLAALKNSEEAGQNEVCTKSARVLASKYPSIAGWILRTELLCAQNISAETVRAAALRPAFNQAVKSPVLFQGPWKENLFNEAINAGLDLARILTKMDRKEAWSVVNKILAWGDSLPKDQWAEAFYLAGELAYLDQKPEAARTFLKQSLDKKTTAEATEKIKTVETVLGMTPPEDKVLIYADLESQVEQELFKRVAFAVKNNDSLVALKDGVTFLNQFPGSKKSPSLDSQLIDILNSLTDKVDRGVTSLVPTRDRALKLLAQAHPHRIFEWMRILHRRADYSGVLFFADGISAIYASSPQSTLFHYIVGRSAHFVGDYVEAQKHYSQLIEKSFGTPESHEAHLRLGLVYLRQEKWGAAAALFEKLTVLQGAEKYELQARYWLIRAWQKSKSTRVAAEIENLLSKFPLSYYGLILRAERSEGDLVWTYMPKPKLEAKLHFTQEQKKAWERMKLLSETGWFEEAQNEILEGNFIPNTSESKALLAAQYAQATTYAQVVKLMSEAGDENPDLRHLELIRVAFPQEFKNAVESQTKEYKINPILAWSLIRQESAYNWRAISSSNALGLMQLIPPTALEVSRELKLPPPEIPEDLFKVDYNIRLGTRYVRNMLNIFGNNVPMALASYNAGPTRVEKWVKLRKETSDLRTRHSSAWQDDIWFDEVPWAETSFYIKAILRNSLIYKMLGESRVQVGPVVWSSLLAM